MIVTSQWKGFPDFSKNDSANFNMEASEKKNNTICFFSNRIRLSKNKHKTRTTFFTMFDTQSHAKLPMMTWLCWGLKVLLGSSSASVLHVSCHTGRLHGKAMGRTGEHMEAMSGARRCFFLTSGSWTSCIKLHKLGFSNPFFCWMGGQSIWKSLKIFGHFETDMMGYYVSFHFHVVLFRIQVILDRLETFFHIRHVLVTKAIYSNQTFGISYPSEGEISLGRLSGWRIRRVTAGLV